MRGDGIMKNIRKTYKLYVNYAFIFSMVLMTTSSSLKVDAPINNNVTIESNNDIKEKMNYSSNKYLNNLFLDRLDRTLPYQHATYQFSEHILSASANDTIENEYSGMALSHEYEDEIKRIASEYGIPYQVMLIIGYRESDGKWDNNGKISSTNDYGEFQINIRNHPYIEEHLGYTTEDLLNDPIKNAEAAAYLIRDVMNHRKVEDLNDIFGMYNGWTGWENKEMSVNYVAGCNKIKETYFSEFVYDHSEYINSNKEVEYYDYNYVIGLISKKIGLKENTQRLNKLMDFKANILKNNPKYRNIIFDCSKIEATLIEMIESDSLTSQETWIEFYNYYLLEVNDLLLQKRCEEAMFRYSKMVNALEEYYNTKSYQYITEQKLIKTY